MQIKMRQLENKNQHFLTKALKRDLDQSLLIKMDILLKMNKTCTRFSMTPDNNLLSSCLINVRKFHTLTHKFIGTNYLVRHKHIEPN